MYLAFLPGGVFGNTAEFGSAFPGSSPGWAAMLTIVRIILDVRKYENET